MERIPPICESCGRVLDSISGKYVVTKKDASNLTVCATCKDALSVQGYKVKAQAK